MQEDINQAAPVFQLNTITLDCSNAEELGDFYAKLLGWRKYRHDEDWLAVIAPGDTFTLLFQQMEDYQPPVWPAQPGQQQTMTHLDFHVSDIPKAVEHALACGAVKAPVQYTDYWTVMIDPQGHPFCICKH